MVERFLEAVRPDYIQYDCKGHYGYTSYPTEVGWASPGIKKDALSIWRRVTQRYGIGLIIHYSGVWDAAAVKHRPEWAAVNADGKPDKFAISIFSKYAEELMIPQLKEVVSRYDVDGAWVDGDCWAVKLDYSDKAIKKFRESTGITDIPKLETDPHWREFKDFHREQFKLYVKNYVDALHKFKPGFQITSNWMFSSLMPDAIDVPLDFLSGDYVHADSVNYARFEARYLASTGKPWDLMAWGYNRGESQKNWSWKTSLQLKQEACVALIQGGGWQVVYQGTRAGFIDDWMIEILADVAKFCRERQKLCHKSTTVPQVALLYSTASVYDKYNSVTSFDVAPRKPVHGPLHALLELHYSVDVKAEHQLTGHLQEYPIVVIPDWHLLPEDFISELKEYVRQGGNLLLAGPQISSLFKDILGVSFEGDTVDMDKYYSELESKAENAFMIYLHPGFAEVNIEADGMLADCGGLVQKVKLMEAEPVSYCYPSKDTRKDRIIASSVNKYGNGMIGAIYVPLGASFYESHAPVLRKAFKKMINRLFPSPMVELDAPNCIDVAIRKKDGKLLIHLSNTSGMQISPRYAIIDYIPPVLGIKMSVRLDAKPRSAEWAYGGNSKDMRYENGKLTLVLDKLEIHDALVIDPTANK